MNERIRELAVKARLLTGWPVGEVEYQKFAELIVQECINTFLSVPFGYKDYRSQIEEAMRDDCVAAVKQHFGVEE